MMVIALVWTVVSLAGLVVSCLNTCDAYLTWQYNQQPLLRRMAHFQLVRSIMRMLALLVFTMIGLLVLIPSTALSGRTLGFGLILGAGIITLAEFYDRFVVLSLKSMDEEKDIR